MSSAFAQLGQFSELWSYRSDSNIVKDHQAILLRMFTNINAMQHPLQTRWLQLLETTKMNTLTVTCFICDSETTITTGSNSESQPLCKCCIH